MPSFTIFKLQLSNDKQNNSYINWNYITFLHEESSVLSHKKLKIQYNINHDVLMDMTRNAFMMIYTVPYNYSVTEKDMKAFNNYWKYLRNIKNAEERDVIKPPFPLFDCNAVMEKSERRIPVTKIRECKHWM